MATPTDTQKATFGRKVRNNTRKTKIKPEKAAEPIDFMRELKSTAESCHKVKLTPGGKVLRRSTSHSLTDSDMITTSISWADSTWIKAAGSPFNVARISSCSKPSTISAKSESRKMPPSAV